MKKNIRKLTILFMILFFQTVLSVITVYAEGTAETGLTPFNARLASIGGFHPAFTDDTMTIFTNPAGFRSIESELLISEITLGLTGPIFNITSAIISETSISFTSSCFVSHRFISSLAQILSGTRIR